MAVCWHEIGVYGSQTTALAQDTATSTSGMLFQITGAINELDKKLTKTCIFQLTVLMFTATKTEDQESVALSIARCNSGIKVNVNQWIKEATTFDIGFGLDGLTVALPELT